MLEGVKVGQMSRLAMGLRQHLDRVDPYFTDGGMSRVRAGTAVGKLDPCITDMANRDDNTAVAHYGICLTDGGEACGCIMQFCQAGLRLRR